MNDIQAQLDLAMKKYGVIGAAVGCIDKEKTQFFYAGSMSADKDSPISKDTIFEIGSITKVFTTLIFTSLVEKNQLNGDDLVDQFLPIKAPIFEGVKITLRHLATHSSGLPSLPTNFTPKNLKNPYQDYTLADLYAFLESFTLTQKPGEKFLYSNLGMGLLAHLLTIKTQKSYAELIYEHVLEPLSMKSSGIDITTVSTKELLCRGHNIGKTVEFWHTPAAIVGSGGLYSTIEDMTRFLAANLGLVSSNITEPLKQCHTPLYSTSIEDEYCGLGWITSRTETGDLIWHDGITGGFANVISFNPTTQKGLVILTNSKKNWLPRFVTPFLLD